MVRTMRSSGIADVASPSPPRSGSSPCEEVAVEAADSSGAPKPLTLVLAKSVRRTPLPVSYSTLSRAYQEPLWPRSWSPLVSPDPSFCAHAKKYPSRSIPHDDGFLRSRSQGCTSSRETSTPHAPIAKRLRPCRTVWRSMRPVQRQILAAKSTCAGAPCRVRVSCQR